MSREASKAPQNIHINGGCGGPGGRGENQGGEGGLGQGPRVNFYDIRTQSVGIHQQIYPGAFLPDAQRTTLNGETFTSGLQIHQLLPTPEGMATVPLRLAEFDHE
ncbi:hypothetical protein FB45DRAFT_1029760 [Roridomyces roridus]|uniref:Uncharacterized protein n=1 Tax=Roridomyces roridus TaxID=1738132 RepID=A0AAD7BQF9_9AGAR|nr:hypothetical protein FB45DRAFT_1029760 [Roridomyces roridus]